MPIYYEKEDEDGVGTGVYVYDEFVIGTSKHKLNCTGENKNKKVLDKEVPDCNKPCKDVCKHVFHSECVLEWVKMKLD